MSIDDCEMKLMMTEGIMCNDNELYLTMTMGCNV